MTYQTHAYLGAELFPVICETWNVTLSRKKFIEGSVKPDMSSLFLRHPHFWRYSRKFIFGKMRALSNATLKDCGKNKKFSENLGIVLHYVADFFTAAHNVKPNKLSEHLAFEELLHKEFQRLVTAESIRNTLQMVTGPEAAHAFRAGDPQHELEELHRRYRPSKTDPVADIQAILIACLYVASAIMNSATAAMGKEAAVDSIAAAGTIAPIGTVVPARR